MTNTPSEQVFMAELIDTVSEVDHQLDEVAQLLATGKTVIPLHLSIRLYEAMSRHLRVASELRQLVAAVEALDAAVARAGGLAGA